jgi:hypothetical protein
MDVGDDRVKIPVCRVNVGFDYSTITNVSTFAVFRKYVMLLWEGSKKMEEKPKQTKGDIGHALAKGVLSGIPYIGGPAAEIFNLVIAPPITKRRDEWMESIAEGLKALEEKVEGFKIEELSKNDTFVTTVMHASQAAIRNHQKEKLEALRAAVLNAASPNAPDEDLQLMFLNWVDELTPLHLRILIFFNSPETWVQTHKVHIPDWAEASPMHVFNTVFPDLKDQQLFLEVLLNDLDLKELIDQSKLNNNMQKMAYLRVTHTTYLGKQFIKFITSPI